MNNDNGSLECPYDLNDPMQSFAWSLALTKHWYKEGLKISYPRLYTAYRCAKALILYVWYKL